MLVGEVLGVTETIDNGKLVLETEPEPTTETERG